MLRLPREKAIRSFCDDNEQSNLTTYRFAGFSLSSPLLLHALPIVPAGSARADFRIVVDDEASSSCNDVIWRHHWRDPSGAISLSFAYGGSDAILHFPDVAKVTASADGTISLTRAHGTSDETLCHILIDQVLPRLLAQRGSLVVHGAAAIIDDKSGIALVGETGHGKSTLSAALAKTGVRLLTDDCFLLESDDAGVRAVPTYPGLRLLPDSLAALYGEHIPETSPVAHYTEKRRLAPAEHADPPHSSAPITAILALQAPSASPEICVTPLQPQQACIELVRNTFQLDLTDMPRVGKLVARAAQVTTHIPVFALSYPRDFTLLPEVVRKILELASTIRRPIRS